MSQHTAGAPDYFALPFMGGDGEPMEDIWAGYTEVAPFLNTTDRIGIFLVYGQSNFSNVIPTTLKGSGTFVGLYTVQNPTKVHMLNPYTGRMSQMKEPLPGASYVNGSILSRLGDQLIAAGKYDRVIFCNVNVGGTTSTQWARNGQWNPRLTVACKRLLNLGRQPTAIIRHQGEQDWSFNFAGALTTANILSEVETVREAGVTAPVVVSIVARGAFDANVAAKLAQYNTTRAAQRAACVNSLGIFEGPDTDQFGDVSRGTGLGVHFTYEYAPIVAQLYRDYIVANF